MAGELYLVAACGLEDSDCYALIHEKNTKEQRKQRAGDWYCSINNQYVNKKYCTKEYCELNDCSVNEYLDRLCAQAI